MLVEDEEALAKLLVEYLYAAGFEVRVRHDGAGIVDEIRLDSPDLVLLDLMLPGMDGIDICKQLRMFSNIPIIMVTARVEEIDRLLGLELGADDYICKPYSPREVIARVKAVLRRAAIREQPAATTGASGLILDEEKYTASLDAVVLDLTPVEFRLLKAMAATPGRVFSRDQLLGRIYNDRRFVTDRTVDTHIKNLRKKLDNIRPGEEMLHSVYGIGYKFEESS